MKRLLLWMLLAGSLAMGQDTLILKSGEQHQIRLIEIRENSAIIEIKGGHLGAESIVQRVSLKVIDKIILKDGTIFWIALAIDTGPKTVIAPQDSSQIAATKDHLRTQTESADASFTTLKLPSELHLFFMQCFYYRFYYPLSSSSALRTP